MSSFPNIESVTPREAKRLVDEEGYTYVDVRSVPEFEQGHPQGAVNVPIAHMTPGGMQPNPDFLKVVRASFAPDSKLVLGCKSGVRSMRAAEALTQAGYTNLVNMDGGFGGRYGPSGTLIQAGWAEEGLSVSTDAGEGVSYESLAAKAG
jgi:rhodanese-related sulfurtransferase